MFGHFRGNLCKLSQRITRFSNLSVLVPPQYFGPFLFVTSVYLKFTILRDKDVLKGGVEELE